MKTGRDAASTVTANGTVRAVGGGSAARSEVAGGAVEVTTCPCCWHRMITNIVID